MESNINLTDLKVEINENISSEIKLTENITIKLKYPEFGIVKDSFQYDDITTVTFNMIANSVEYIYDGQQFYYGSEAQPGEMVEFIEGLNQSQFSKIEDFFNNLPKLKETVHMNCGKCGFKHNIDVEGLENFFG